LIVVFVACLLLVLAGIAVLHYYRENQRTQQLQSAALRLGFSFSADAGPGLREGLGQFHLFRQGHARKVYNVMHREIHDIMVTLFDYRYTISSSRHRRIRHQTAVLFETDRLRLPLFTLRPEHLFHKLGQAFGYQDIDFEDHPVFSETYLLQGPDEDRIRSLFTEQVRSYYTRHASLCTEGQGRQLAFYRAERRVDSGAIEGFLQEGLDVLDSFMERDGLLGIPPLLDIGLQQAPPEDRSTAAA
jgi:hypothetical protein